MWSYEEFISDTRQSGETSTGDSAQGDSHFANSGEGPRALIEEMIKEG